MPELVPVDHDPFGPQMVPVEHDPFSEVAPGGSEASSSMLLKAVRGIGQQLLDLAKIPGQAYQSKEPITTAEMIKPATDLAMSTTLGAGAIPAEENAMRMGIKAYHGSPHDFEKFDASKIGIGEGAQSYGHGLYFAEAPETAEHYKRMLSVGDTGLTVDEAQRNLNYLKDSLKDPNWGGRAGFDSDAQMLASAERDLAAAKSRVPQGRMYEVDIAAEPEQFIDWDKPLSEQSEVVQQKLGLVPSSQMAPSGKPYLKSEKFGGWHDPEETTGADFYRRAGSSGSGSGFSPPKSKLKELAAQNLKEAGIPGIKYLDQGSRGASEAHGTRNFVLFGDDLVKIVKKYAAAGLALPPAVAAAYEQQFKPVEHDPFAGTR